jgi:uncharacterized protein (TIGR00661 family)
VLSKFNSRVLIAPLDWGLGHVTRCIPLITHLQQMGYQVVVAGEEAQQKLLSKEFPLLEFVYLRGYWIRYVANKRYFALNILLQLPKIYRIIRHEKKWLNDAIQELGIDAVISDNRYGLYNARIATVFITHQLTIKAPYSWMQQLMQKINYRLIRNFGECWVPDFKGAPNLAALLSHPQKLPRVPVSYLGPLSRFERKENLHMQYTLLIVISGPEPQRSFLEKLMLSQLEGFERRVLLVRGLPGDESRVAPLKNVVIKNHLSATEMEAAFNESEFIISRSGYTTVMDVCKLQKKAIFIPTPGQTEQEYLADHLHQQGWSLKISQEDFDIRAVLSLVKTFPFKIPSFDMTGYKQVIEQFLGKLQNR